MKHTPGPWRRFGGMVDGYGITSNKEVVIEADPFNGLNNEANARLIASAPDMEEKIEKLEALNAELLEVLKSFIDDEECNFDHHGYCQTHGVSLPCRNQKAKQAIFKAEEETR